MSYFYPPEHQSNVGAPKLEYPGQLPRLTPPEKHFVTQLLSDIPKDGLMKKTALQILNSDTSPHTNIDFSLIQLSVAEKQSELPQTYKTGIPVILSIPEKTSNSYSQNFGTDDIIIKKLASGDNAPVNKIYKPEFVTLAPPLLNCEDEPKTNLNGCKLHP
ncbi:CCR4-NOT transcription complex subunit 11 [Anoplophora glabripennis]|uniref:CCR4-NOT transcription complex subunit 11 n=1 Tax=Anoplophora glabripennis TaxID=217634 RepID=UPI000C767451|nr:CCR4-NOT transcription complex subunit 11 [Anoplophora glabripennis]